MAQGPLIPSKAPNLPVAPQEYAPVYVDKLTNVLRLYFNTIDSDFAGLLGTIGAQYLNVPHIAASDTTDQYATATNTPTKIAWNTQEAGAGFTLNSDGTATPAVTGVYKITYSLQFANTANAVHDAAVWLQVDGTDVARSSTYFSIPARKSAGVPSYVCGYSEVVFTVEGGQNVALYWATDQAYSTTGPVDGVYIFADAAQTVPYARPAIPSAIGSIVFVSDTR